MTYDEVRAREVKLDLVNDLKSWPRDLEYDVERRTIVHGWTKCNDMDIISSAFRRWREDANKLHIALRRDTEKILKIDIKGDQKTEDDIYARSYFIDNIESFIGKGSGEDWLGWDYEVRWSKELDYLQAQNVFPREKVSPNVYATVSFIGHLWLEQKSIDRAHNQIHNQNQKCFEPYLDLPPMTPTQLMIRLTKATQHEEYLLRSLEFQRIQKANIINRLVSINSDKNMKRLISSESETSKTYDFNDIYEMANPGGGSNGI